METKKEPLHGGSKNLYSLLHKNVAETFKQGFSGDKVATI